MDYEDDPVAPCRNCAELAKLCAELKSRLLVGPTGAYPEGKLTHDDDGELAIAVEPVCNKYDPTQRRVAMRFGTAVSWIAMSSDDARAIAIALMSAATVVDAETPADDDADGG